MKVCFFILLCLFGTFSFASDMEIKSLSVDYLCGGARNVHVDYINNPGFYVMVNFEGKSYELDRVVAASGAKYSDKEQEVVWWNKGKTGFLMFNDKIVVRDCVENKRTEIDNKALQRINH